MDLEHDARRVYRTLWEGGLVVVPTVAGYGLIAMRPGAVERIYALKGRPGSKPCVTVATWPVFDDVALPVSADVRGWIGEVTRAHPLAVVAPVNPRSRLLGALDPFVRAQCTRDGTVAAFHRAGPLVTRVAELAFADDHLVVGSSGNLSGNGNAYLLEEVAGLDEADLVIDVGPIPMLGGARLATTLLDLGTGRFLREGLGFAEIAASWARLRGEDAARAA